MKIAYTGIQPVVLTDGKAMGAGHAVPERAIGVTVPERPHALILAGHPGQASLGAGAPTAGDHEEASLEDESSGRLREETMA
jgi:hypothetical protein